MYGKSEYEVGCVPCKQSGTFVGSMEGIEQIEELLADVPRPRVSSRAQSACGIAAITGTCRFEEDIETAVELAEQIDVTFTPDNR